MTLRQLRSRIVALATSRRRDADLDDEIRFHLEEETEERAAAGLGREEAQRAARRDFGNAVAIRERTRETWGWPSVERFFQDARSALRMARREPGFSAVAAITLALGIGATTAVFNVVNGLLLRPLALPEPDRLVTLFATTPARGVLRDTTSFLDITAWQTETPALAGAAAYRQDPFNLTGDGAPEPLTGVRASYELLTVLGTPPALGRSFTRDEQKGKVPVVLISDRLWTQRYGRDPSIVGKTILLNEISHLVIGVLPPGWQFPAYQTADVVVPVEERTCRGCGYIRAVARLKPGVTAAMAQQQLDVVAARRAQAFPDSNTGRGVNVVRLQDVAVGPVRTPLFVLLGSGVFVLLIGCGNVGNLVLARGIARQRELAVRSALGAGTGRLVRQLLTESLALATLAALLGVALAYAGSGLLTMSLSQRFPLPEIAFNWTLVGFAFAVALAAGLLSGAPPALMVWRSDLSGALKADGRSHSDGAPQQRLRSLLLVGQTALTVMLLVGAGLLLKSFVRLQQIDLGMDTRQGLMVDLLLSTRNADPARRPIYVGELLDSVRSLPGVVAAASHVNPPLSGEGRRETFHVEGHADPAPGRGHVATYNSVSDQFFQAMDIPIVRGRAFGSEDTAAGLPVAIVNETMARRFWPQEDAIGKRLQYFYDKEGKRPLTIVGVVRDVRYAGRLFDPLPQVFVPRQQPFLRNQEPYVCLVVRTTGDPSALAAAVQARIWAVDKDQPIMTLQTMEQALWEAAAEPRVYSVLLGVFAAVALLIAAAGICGLSAYAVVRRTREIGIRLAIGATPGEVLALVVRQGMLLIAIGLIVGVGGALALSRVMSGFLYGVTPTDTVTFLGVFVVFAVVALLATYIPARRAARIDPALAFRYE